MSPLKRRNSKCNQLNKTAHENSDPTLYPRKVLVVGLPISKLRSFSMSDSILTTCMQIDTMTSIHSPQNKTLNKNGKQIEDNHILLLSWCKNTQLYHRSPAHLEGCFLRISWDYSSIHHTNENPFEITKKEGNGRNFTGRAMSIEETPRSWNFFQLMGTDKRNLSM